MPYFTCIFGKDDCKDSFVDTTPDLRITINELRALCKPKLLYYEFFNDAGKAIDRHIELKHISQDRLDEIVKKTNPEKEDLALLL